MAKLRTRQAMFSDWSKQAKKRVPTNWGGRYADGYQDMKKPRGFFAYRKRPYNPKIRRRIYHYTTAYRRSNWKSYNKKY